MTTTPDSAKDLPPIEAHEGSKYLRTVHDATDLVSTVRADVYAVLEAFKVTCPGRQQAIKKLLCAGLRGKGSELDDLYGAAAAISRAVELQTVRESKAGPPEPSKNQASGTSGSEVSTTGRTGCTTVGRNSGNGATN